ncbi:MAG: transposase [Lachnospiraceae bacterium]|nr:transposase [Lachnospiraceae bacterium]
MQQKTCPGCGANLEYNRVRNLWTCGFCGQSYEGDIPAPAQEESAAKPKSKVDFFKNGVGKTPVGTSSEGSLLNPQIFRVELDLDESLEMKRTGSCIRSIAEIIKNYTTSEEIENYICRKLSIPDDIAVKGTHEDAIQNIMPQISSILDPGERVILYENKGIFSKGKEFTAITDKRSIFVDKKKVKQVMHADIDALKISNTSDCPNCYVNGGFEQGIVALDTECRVQAAVICLLCVLSFEADPKREPIRLT